MPIEVMVNSNRAAKWDFGGRIYHRPPDDATTCAAASRSCSPRRSTAARSTSELSGGDRTAMRQFLAFYGELDRERRLHARRPLGLCGAAGRLCQGGPARRAADARRADAPAAPPACRSSSRSFSTSRRRCSSRSAAWTGSRTRFTSRCARRSASAARSPRSAAAARACASSTGPATRRSTPIIASAPCRSTCCSGSRTISRRPSRRRSATCPICPAPRSAFESPRFWEEEGIYGGLGWTDQANENLLYPSGGWHSDKGVLVAAYVAGWTGQNHPSEFIAMSHEERFRVCREVVERMHPGKARLLDKAGHRLLGRSRPGRKASGRSHPDFGGRPRAARATPSCCGPKARSSSPASISPTSLFWQEGAALSAHAAMRVLAEQAAARRRLSLVEAGGALRRNGLGGGRRG